jgi:hypothetical protein
VRHALRAAGSVLTYALRDRLPFDIAGQRMQRYTLKRGQLDPETVDEPTPDPAFPEPRIPDLAAGAPLEAWR